LFQNLFEFLGLEFAIFKAEFFSYLLATKTRLRAETLHYGVQARRHKSK